MKQTIELRSAGLTLRQSEHGDTSGLPEEYAPSGGGEWASVWEITDGTRTDHARFCGEPQGGVTELDITLSSLGAEKAALAASALAGEALKHRGLNTVRIYPASDTEAFLKAAHEAGLTTASNGMAVKDRAPSPWTYVMMCVGIVAGAVVGFAWKGKLWAIVIGFLLFGLLGSMMDMRVRLKRYRMARSSRPFRIAKVPDAPAPVPDKNDTGKT